MENVIINSTVRNMFFTAAIALFTFAPLAKAHALETGKEDPVAITYLGAVGNQPLFQIEFDNLEEEEIIVSLRDAENNVIYTERFKEKKFSKKFQLSREEGNLLVTLSLTTKKNKQTQQFLINHNTRIVEDVLVTRVR